jgi:ubiquinone/menaquinone biosynthesis C-methylase UbiE
MNVSAAYTDLDIVANRLFGVGRMPEPMLVLGAQVVVELVRRVEWRAGDVFVDLGAGLGQVVLTVHLLAGVRAWGVEIEPAYCDYARRCAVRLVFAGVDFIEGDAREVDLSDGTVFFLFTPFRGKVFRDVMARLREEAVRREIRVAGYGPCGVELAGLEWLRREGDEGEGVYSLKLFRSCLLQNG